MIEDHDQGEVLLSTLATTNELNPNLGGGGRVVGGWLSQNNSETVKAINCSISILNKVFTSYI